jgi:hypothetical protein
MAPSNLRDIHAFPDLVRYLEDELDWPLRKYGFDELTFEFTPAELGLKEEDAARIKAIHQLRPLAAGQPWGIFFVEFENKKLPVVVLRRILSHLVIKKRESANKAKAPAWHAEDLLFVTAFGEDGTDAREIAFAHFHQNPGDLPTLHVLGWDGEDTPLKLANVDHVLRERLHWPEDESDADAWRDTWRKPFKHRIGHVIQTADLLADELARLARGIRDKARRMLKAESDKGPLTKLYKAFQTALIHDLTPESFADTYAQTITYGLLTAAISRTEMSEGRNGTALVAENVVDMVPVTNPFLKEMLQTFLKVGGRKGGIDFDELGIQDVVELLRGDETDLPAILRDFGNRNRGEDPVIHFYEHFLSAYDKQLKIQRGVFYTPQPVVSYIVRSVHELLQTEFGLEDGLASTITWGEMLSKNPGLKLPPLTDAPDEKRSIPPNEPFVQILDPATGTATFLVEVIDVIHRTLTTKWKQQRLTEVQQQAAWNDYVPTHLLPRLHAYELMMAPYAIAHMKIGLKLAETGYRFGTEERARIYLTNALEPWQRQLKLPDFEALAHEATAVNEIKREKRFTVVIGNPPYSVLSTNNGSWIQGLLADFQKVDGQPLGERNSQSLQDDYVKFLRLAAHFVMSSGYGVIGFITPHGFLDNPTFRGMRQQLNSHFTRLHFLDLHGNANKKERCPDGSLDQNVFEIQQGTAISVLAKTSREGGDSSYGELWGTREGVKYPFLATKSVSTSPMTRVAPQSPHYLLIPRDYELYQTFSSWPPITDLMPIWNNGLMTSRDDFVFAFQDSELCDRLKDFAAKPVEEAISKYNLRDVREMTLKESQALLRKIGDLKDHIQPCLYRPMDVRRLFYHQCLVRWPVFGLMREMSKGNNVGLVTSRMTKGEVFAHVMATRHPVEKIALSSKTSNNAYLFPLVIKAREHAGTLFTQDQGSSVNLSAMHLAGWLSRLGLDPILSVGSDGNPSATATAVFSYFFAVLHSPSYRSQYAEFLRGEFPRLPLTSNLELFRALAWLGGELVALHLLESPKVNDFISRFEGKGDNSIPKKPAYKDGAVWINATQRFEGVPEAVWNFHIGGYQVCEKWLKDRKGRTLTTDDITHFQRIVVALNETICLMAEIDRVIETHGGWPSAFASKAKAGTQS